MTEVITPARFLIYARSYCHLCDDMRDALMAAFDVRPEDIRMIDVDASETLVAAFDEWVPVLFGVARDGGEVKLCHYFLEREAVAAFLAAQGA